MYFQLMRFILCIIQMLEKSLAVNEMRLHVTPVIAHI